MWRRDIRSALSLTLSWGRWLWRRDLRSALSLTLSVNANWTSRPQRAPWFTRIVKSHYIDKRSSKGERNISIAPSRWLAECLEISMDCSNSHPASRQMHPISTIFNNLSVHGHRIITSYRIQNIPGCLSSLTRMRIPHGDF